MHNEETGHEFDAVLHGAVGTDDERVEDQPQRVLRQARTIVLNVHADVPILARALAVLRGDADLAALGQTYNLVLNQQLEQPDELGFVHGKRRQRVREPEFDADFLGRQLVLEFFQHAHKDFV